MTFSYGYSIIYYDFLAMVTLLSAMKFSYDYSIICYDI